MSEPEKQKRGFSAMFTRRDLFLLVISIFASAFIGLTMDLAFGGSPELKSARASAYVSIAEFTPLNFLERYLDIVFAEGNEPAERMAAQQQEQALVFRDFACRMRNTYAIGGSRFGRTRQSMHTTFTPPWPSRFLSVCARSDAGSSDHSFF